MGEFPTRSSRGVAAYGVPKDGGFLGNGSESPRLGGRPDYTPLDVRRLVLVLWFARFVRNLYGTGMRRREGATDSNLVWITRYRDVARLIEIL